MRNTKSAVEIVNAGDLATALERNLGDIERDSVVRRIWDRDGTLWKPEDREISNRLGWLDAPRTAGESYLALEAFAASVRDVGLTRAVVLGMGGSSLAPEVFARAFPTGPGGLELEILDTTEPGTVAAAGARFDPRTTLFVVSSKSGTTAEVMALLAYFYDRARTALGIGHAGSRFVAVTDPGTPLEGLARELHFRRVWPGPPDVGGRFSALTSFGLLPAALKGIDLGRLLLSARAVADACRRPAARENPGALLGVFLGTAALEGIDKLTLLLTRPLSPLAAWIEQLIAESTGKDGRGIVPVFEDRRRPAGPFGPDRLFVEIGPSEETAPKPGPRAPKGPGPPLSAWPLTTLTNWPANSSFGSSPRPWPDGSWPSIPSTSPTSSRPRRRRGRSWPPRTAGEAPPERLPRPSAADSGWPGPIARKDRKRAWPDSWPRAARGTTSPFSPFCRGRRGSRSSSRGWPRVFASRPAFPSLSDSARATSIRPGSSTRATGTGGSF